MISATQARDLSAEQFPTELFEEFAPVFEKAVTEAANKGMFYADVTLEQSPEGLGRDNYFAIRLSQLGYKVHVGWTFGENKRESNYTLNWVGGVR